MIASFILPYLITFIVGLIVGRIGAYKSGFDRGLKKAVILLRNEQTQKWHDVDKTTPGCSGTIILCQPESAYFIIGFWDAKTRTLTQRDIITAWDWNMILKSGYLEKWCYAKDLL